MSIVKHATLTQLSHSKHIFVILVQIFRAKLARKSNLRFLKCFKKDDRS